MFRRLLWAIMLLATLGIVDLTMPNAANGQYVYDPYWWPRRGYDYSGAPYYPGYGPPYYPGYGPPYYPGYGPPYYPGYGPPYYPGYGPPYRAGISPHDPSPWYRYPPYRAAYPNWYGDRYYR
jgi:hypothetical protein